MDQFHPTIDRQPLNNCFVQWREEQETLGRELTESLASLTEYQSLLDGWQQELVAQREELERGQVQLKACRAGSDDQQQRIEQLQRELAKAQEQTKVLSDEVLAKCEEIQQVEHGRAEFAKELQQSRARQQELGDQLAESRQQLTQAEQHYAEQLEAIRDQLEQQVALEPVPAAESTAAKSYDPVLGSVVAQFDKLRQQQAQGRRDRSKNR